MADEYSLAQIKCTFEFRVLFIEIQLSRAANFLVLKLCCISDHVSHFQLKLSGMHSRLPVANRNCDGTIDNLGRGHSMLRRAVDV